MRTHLKNSLLLWITLLFIQCTPSKETPYKILDPGNMKVITPIVNPSLQTMAILYGNATAYQTALYDSKNPTGGEQYTFITWRYRENPRWYGSSISDIPLAIESLQIVQDDKGYLTYEYSVEKGIVPKVDGKQLTTKQRIDYLLSYRVAETP